VSKTWFSIVFPKFPSNQKTKFDKMRKTIFFEKKMILQAAAEKS